MGPPEALLKGLSRFRTALEREFGSVDHVILFGSQARGATHADSDVDVIVVSAGFEGVPPLQRMAVARGLFPLGGPVDIICYTPAQFHRLSRQVSLVSVALAEGIEVAAA